MKIYSILPKTLVLIACLLWPFTAKSQDSMFGVWKYSCSDGPCQAFFDLKAPEADQLAIGMGLIHSGETDEATLILRTPIRSALPPGMRLTITEDRKTDIPFQFCDDSVCVGFLRLDAETLDALSVTETVDVTYIMYGQRKPIAYTVPINGFAGALDRLKKP
ncbi:invasion associated locus B family protein [Kordiimonas sp.]|uniref:invasion associated locus B family protein n=1 Tax=Kordiimonas sp. TaxID=1970157 RepID=UPI003A8D215A